jgi:hypothetical protein
MSHLYELPCINTAARGSVVLAMHQQQHLAGTHTYTLGALDVHGVHAVVFISKVIHHQQLLHML